VLNPKRKAVSHEYAQSSWAPPIFLYFAAAVCKGKVSTTRIASSRQFHPISSPWRPQRLWLRRHRLQRSFHHPATLHTLMGNGTGNCTTGLFLELPTGVLQNCKLGEFNGNHRLALFCTTSHTATASAVFFIGNGDGTFALPKYIALPSPLRPPRPATCPIARMPPDDTSTAPSRRPEAATTIPTPSPHLSFRRR
jgi:hypothetical protein